MTLSIPATRANVALVRSVVAGVAAKAAMTLDDVEDVRLAIDEVCAQLLMLGRNGRRITIEIDRTDSALEIAAQIDTVFGNNGEDASLSWRILQALVDEAFFETDVESSTIRLIKAIR